jgi:hypothetical protein
MSSEFVEAETLRLTAGVFVCWKLTRYAGVMPKVERISQDGSKESNSTVKVVAVNPFASSRKETEKQPQPSRQELFAEVKRITPELYAPGRRASKTRRGSPEVTAPHMIASGGEHLVFEFPDARHSDVVLKVNFQQTLPVLQAHRHGEIARKKALENMEEAMVERRSQLRELREYFGHSAVPVTRFQIQDMPVSPDIVEKLHPGWLQEGQEVPSTLPAWVVIQRRLDLQPEKTVSLTGYYLEDPRMPKGEEKEFMENYKTIYELGHDILVGKEVEDLSAENQQEIVLRLFPNLKKVAEKNTTDPVFKKKLQDTVRKLIAYTDDTKTALDLAGANNVVLIEGEKGWDLKMPDALPTDEVRTDDISLAAEELEKGEPLTSHATIVKNALNTVRMINALALVSGIPERLHVPGLETIPAETWRQVLSEKLPEENSRG